MRTLTASCLILVLLLLIVPPASAQTHDWDSLRNFLGREVAISTRDGDMRFGVLRFVNDSEIKVQFAEDQQFATQETDVRRHEVVKLWRARLRFDERKTTKGALIGLGVGLGAGFVTALVMAGRDNSDPPHGFALFPLTGAGVGAIVGASRRKGHKKQELIYSI